MKFIDLTNLSGNIGGVISSFGAYMQHCAIYCLTSQNHLSGVKFNIKTNTKTIEYEILWDAIEDNNFQRSMGDEERATEFGAMGLAILLTLKLTDYRCFEVAGKGTGVDFLLYKDDLKNDFAKLEVSGIRSANTSNNLLKRLNTKKKQAQKSKDKSKKTYISIVEFNTPESSYSRY